MIVVSILLLIYGNTYTAWAFYYWFTSFSTPLPWHTEYTGGYMAIGLFSEAGLLE